MLHLKTRVHFEEVEALVFAGCNELHGSCAIIVHGFGERDSLLAHFLTRRFVEQRRWRLFQDFLVAALDRAFALKQIDAIAVLIAHDLDFDMARLENEFLDEDPVIPEGRGRFSLHRGIALFNVFIVIRDPNAFTAAACGGFDHDGIADLAADFYRLFGVIDQAHMSWNRRNARLCCELFRTDLVAHRFDRVCVRTDEDDLLFLKTLREFRVFRQKPEAWVNRFGTGLLHRVDDFIHDQIGFGGRRCTNVNGFICHFDGHRTCVGI